jgi:hypothetical protein
MAPKSNSGKKKPGPDPERLVIEGDPEEALRRLLGKQERQHSGRVVLLHDRWGGDDDFESHKVVSSYDSLEEAKAAAVEVWRERECDRERGDMLLIFPIGSTPDVSSALGVYRGYWE